MLWVSSCASNPDEILQAVRLEESRLTEMWDRQLARCTTDACRAAVNQGFQELMLKLGNLRVLVAEQRLEDWKRERELIRETIKRLIPSYPELKDLLPRVSQALHTDTGSISLNAVPVLGSGGEQSSSHVAANNPSGNGPLGDDDGASSAGQSTSNNEMPYPGGDPLVQYQVTGSVEVVGGPRAGTLTLVGSWWLAPLDQSGTRQIVEGSFTMTLGGVTIAAWSVNQPIEQSRIVSAVGGTPAMLELFIGFDATLLAGSQWTACLASPMMVRVPISEGANGGLTASFAGPFRRLEPFQGRWPSSDFDGSGLLQRTSDYAAFLSAWGAGQPAADLNRDGVWDSADVDLWNQRFDQDLPWEP